MTAREALLVLEDGTAFAGEAFTAAPATVAGEVVFNTAMGGYQEVLTDPSYAGQLVCMAAPEVGNYGTVPADAESDGSRWPRSWSGRRPGGPPAGGPSAAWPRSWRRPACPGSRASTPAGWSGTCASAGPCAAPSPPRPPTRELRELALAAPDPNGLAMVDRVTRAEPAELPADGDERLRVVLYDFGAKANIARRLRRLGARVLAVPAATPAAEALAWRPDGVMLSNGPGDPATVGHGVRATRELLGRVPVFGICLGHQLLGQAVGGRTVRLKFGHRGVNQPVVELATGRVAVTSHNHGFAVDGDSLPAGSGSPTPTPTTASSRAWSAWTCPPSRSSTTPRPRPAPTTPTPCSSGSPT